MKISKKVFAVFLVLSILFATGCVPNETPSGSEAQTPGSSSSAPTTGTQTPAPTTQASTPTTLAPTSGTQAPNASKWEIADATVYNADGEPVRLSDFLGKPVVINVWATWCQPCREELPDFQKAYEKYGDRVEFVMVNLTYSEDDTFDVVGTFLKLMGYDFPVYYDKDASIWENFKIESVPDTYFVYPNGELLTYRSVSISGEDLEDFIERLLE